MYACVCTSLHSHTKYATPQYMYVQRLHCSHSSHSSHMCVCVCVYVCVRITIPCRHSSKIIVVHHIAVVWAVGSTATTQFYIPYEPFFMCVCVCVCWLKYYSHTHTHTHTFYLFIHPIPNQQLCIPVPQP